MPETPQTDESRRILALAIIEDDDPLPTIVMYKAIMSERLAKVERQARQAEHERVLALEKALGQIDSMYAEATPRGPMLYWNEVHAIVSAALAQQDTGHETGQ